MSKRSDAMALLDKHVPDGIEIQSKRDKEKFALLTGTSHEPLSPMAGRGRLRNPRRWSSWGNRVGRVIGKSVTH
jgi:hypothetical protein